MGPAWGDRPGGVVRGLRGDDGREVSGRDGLVGIAALALLAWLAERWRAPQAATAARA
jgi:hypothetical protein